MNFEYLSDQDVVKYEPYRPMNLEETKAELTLRIDDEEMIAVELKVPTESIPNVTRKIPTPGDFWKGWDLQKRPISNKMSFSGKMRRVTPSGRIPLHMPC